MKKIIVLVSIILVAGALQAQSVDDFYSASNRINQAGMLVLGGWAISNMAYGGYGWSKYNDERKYFGQMNVMWNIVNASIAGFALYQFHNTDIASLTTEQMIANHNKTQNLYLFNAGLDVLYMAGGAYMINVSRRSEKYGNLLKGYGQSVILQGGFLFAFDLVMYFIQRNHINSFDLSQKSIALTPNGINLSFVF